jgi:integrase
VDQLLDLWLASNPGKRSSTIGRDKAAIGRHIRPHIGNRELRSIRQPDVQALVNRWTKAGLSPATVERTFGTLRAAFNYAVDSEMIARTPCRKINLPKRHKPMRRDYGVADVEALARAMPKRYAPMIPLAAAMGLRWGEVAGLRVSGLDLLNRRMTIVTAVVRDEHGGSSIGRPKSEDGGVRSMDIPEQLVDMLAAHLAAMGTTAADPDAPVFQNRRGGHLTYANFRQRIWKPAAEAAGLPDIAFHDLRRTASTQAYQTGAADPKTIGARLGHTDPRLTLDLYAQANADADRAVADALGDRFASVMLAAMRDSDAIETDESDAVENTAL